MATNPATTDDIESRWRPLTSAETPIATTRLDDAWRKLKKDVPGLEARLDGGLEPDLEDDVRRVLADSVIRLLQSLARNGLRKGSVDVDDGSTSWELDAAIQSALYFTDSEIGDLTTTGRRRGPRAYSVQPS